MQDNVRNITTVKERYNLKIKREKGITLVALVITIVVLIILAGIAISMTVGENGIFIKAKEAKRLQITAEAKEKIGTDILDAQIEATQKNEQLQQSKVEEIIAKYGELQADGDTIKLKDNGYEVSLKEIYNGSTSSSGGSTGGSTGSAELDSLKVELAQTNATEDKILKDYKAYSNGKLMTGTMENYAGQTQEVTSTSDDTYTYLSIPNAGYYGTDSKLKTLNSNLGNNIAGYSIYIDGNGNPTICCGLFYNGSNHLLSHIKHWYYTELGTQNWYDIQLTWNQSTTSFVITALNECYYSYNVDMSNKQKLSKNETISLYHRNAIAVYFQSI